MAQSVDINILLKIKKNKTVQITFSSFNLMNKLYTHTHTHTHTFGSAYFYKVDHILMFQMLQNFYFPCNI
jgi:hypothetical protein